MTPGVGRVHLLWSLCSGRPQPPSLYPPGWRAWVTHEFLGSEVGSSQQTSPGPTPHGLV